VDGGITRGSLGGSLLEAEREEIVFHGVDAVEAPIGIGAGLGGLGFEQTWGLEPAWNWAQWR